MEVVYQTSLWFQSIMVTFLCTKRFSNFTTQKEILQLFIKKKKERERDPPTTVFLRREICKVTFQKSIHQNKKISKKAFLAFFFFFV